MPHPKSDRWTIIALLTHDINLMGPPAVESVHSPSEQAILYLRSHLRLSGILH